MSPHLNEQAMLRWHAGESTEAERSHVAACEGCRQRLQPLAEALRCFGTEARGWAAGRAAARTQIPQVRQRGRSLAAAAAFACLLLIAAGLFSRWQTAPRPGTSGRTAAPATFMPASDDALLEAVDQDVSRQVPEAMQPLSPGTSTTAAPHSTRQ